MFLEMQMHRLLAPCGGCGSQHSPTRALAPFIGAQICEMGTFVSARVVSLLNGPGTRSGDGISPRRGEMGA
ncbi:protein of unknown function [Bradyrhizobium vignae]|uniref:Uncharacterized protein n=1 Tax=Bradyrhizobium vignae TaxID=1549949 RepID=A0A2U3PV09_9BRAD|nr:protein of unknown function [Bradyrhizobium vignae]